MSPDDENMEDDFQGKILWDLTMPTGQLKKTADITKLKKLGWDEFTDFNASIQHTCDWFVENYPKVRGIAYAKS